MAEAGHVGADLSRGLVAGDGAHEPADEEVEVAVAVDVGGVGDVLAVGEDGLAARVAEGVGHQHEAGAAGLAPVEVEAHVAERLLGEEVGVAVGVGVHEAEPLADLQVGEAVGPEGVAGAVVAPIHALEEEELAGALLDDEVEVAVRVHVHELRPGDVEAAEEGKVVRLSPGAPDGEGGHASPEVAGGRGRARGRPGRGAHVGGGASARGAPRRGEGSQERRHQRHGSRRRVPGPHRRDAAATPAPYGGISTTCRMVRVAASMTVRVPSGASKPRFWRPSHVPCSFRLET